MFSWRRVRAHDPGTAFESSRVHELSADLLDNAINWGHHHPLKYINTFLWPNVGNKSILLTTHHQSQAGGIYRRSPQNKVQLLGRTLLDLQKSSSNKARWPLILCSSIELEFNINSDPPPPVVDHQ